jgi:hypothetical protein
MEKWNDGILEWGRTEKGRNPQEKYHVGFRDYRLY